MNQTSATIYHGHDATMNTPVELKRCPVDGWFYRAPQYAERWVDVETPRQLGPGVVELDGIKFTQA